MASSFSSQRQGYMDAAAASPLLVAWKDNDMLLMKWVDTRLVMICKVGLSEANTQNAMVAVLEAIVKGLSDYKKRNSAVSLLHSKMLQTMNPIGDDRFATCIKELQTPWDPGGIGTTLHWLGDKTNFK
ncbi:hypothetical protein E2562_029947 [Oryza meyeriana var. granulata]|uniref:Uncharacterized protein n=1 Tax=Oryza meyeriana var. granulata TaxID=110450 RepID=A0A6G1CWE8_9ORYZ|nr:hypothetical protein E2562_029947 [Oryza meyeriana var. granulata]